MKTMTKLQISRHTTSNFGRIIVFLFFWQGLRLAEHPDVGKKIVEESRDKQGTQVTPYHIPSKDSFEHQQEEHLYQKTSNRREIEQRETHPESTASPIYNAALPYPEVRPQVITHHRKLE